MVSPFKYKKGNSQTFTSGNYAANMSELLALVTNRTVLALTGAGMSTDSGIPDYRGPTSIPRQPMTIQQFLSDPEFRQMYWARNHVGWQQMWRAEPNTGHFALAELEAMGVVQAVITQNVDRLHLRAGSKNVIELHGHFEDVLCLDCGRIISRESLHHRLSDLNPDFHPQVQAWSPDADADIGDTRNFEVADCEACGGILKPDIVYFGESVPKPRVEQCYQLVDQAEAVLVLGSSLTVMSGLRFVRHAAKNGTPVIIVNRGATRGDDLATLKIDAGVSETLSEIVAKFISA